MACAMRTFPAANWIYFLEGLGPGDCMLPMASSMASIIDSVRSKDSVYRQGLHTKFARVAADLKRVFQSHRYIGRCPSLVR